VENYRPPSGPPYKKNLMTNFTVAVAPWTPMLVHLLPLISNPSMVSTAYTHIVHTSTYVFVRVNINLHVVVVLTCGVLVCSSLIGIVN
jgi:hypothetical protein